MIELFLVNFGYGCAFIALAIREVLWLRIILTLSFIVRCYSSYSFSNNLNVAFWNFLFILVNIVMIIRILDERRSRFIPHEIKDIKNTIFKNLTSKEFLYLWSLGKIQTINKGVIVDEGIKQNKLMFMLSGKAQVKSGEKLLAILERGQFIAEMSLLTNEPTSAKVVVDDKDDEDILYIEWNKQTLKRIETTNNKFWEKLHYILSNDITKKLQLMNKSN